MVVEFLKDKGGKFNEIVFVGIGIRDSYYLV
jgi:hypothetical protein